MFSQIVVGTGIHKFYEQVSKDSIAWGILGASTALFFIALIAGEIRH